MKTTYVVFPERGEDEIPPAHLYPFSMDSCETAVPFDDEADGEGGVSVSGSSLAGQN